MMHVMTTNVLFPSDKRRQTGPNERAFLPSCARKWEGLECLTKKPSQQHLHATYHTQGGKFTHTHTQHTHTHNTRTHTHSLSLTHNLSLSPSLTHTHSLCLAHTHILSLSLSHTHTHILSLTHTHTFSLSLSLSLFRSLPHNAVSLA